VRYASAGAFRAALEQRLLEASRNGNIPLTRLRKLVTFERLLARLLVVSPDRWILKGAVALNIRLGARARTTQDLDLGRWDNEETASDDLEAVEQIDLGDHFRFAIKRTAKLDQLVEGAAVRYHVTASLAGRRFEELNLDVGFADRPPTAPEKLLGPDLLIFAEISATPIPTIPLELHVAEKLHAYSRQYAGGRPSTRVKDLIDLVLISSFLSFESQQLRSALQTTFNIRGTHPLPPEIPQPPLEWSVGYAKMAAEVGLVSELTVGYEQAKAFLDPILSGSALKDTWWDPLFHRWQPDRP
jgi:predicted nucleotidyltransferase component of viral defense system